MKKFSDFEKKVNSPDIVFDVFKNGFEKVKLFCLLLFNEFNDASTFVFKG